MTMSRAVVRREGLAHALHVTRALDTETEAMKKGEAYLCNVYGITERDRMLASGELTIDVYPDGSINPTTGVVIPPAPVAQVESMNIGTDETPMMITQCMDCGAFAEGEDVKVIHYKTCQPGEAKKWEQYYSQLNPGETP